MAIDPGAPVEVGAPQEARGKPAEKSEVEKLREEFQTERERTTRELQEARRSEQYWSERAKHVKHEPEPESADEPPPLRPAAVDDDNAEKFLDDVSKDGSAALKKRGFLTADELEDRLKKERERNDERVNSIAANTSVDTQIAREFPEILEDNARVNRKEAPQSELYKRTSRIFQEMVADEPALKNARGTILIAARQAKRLMEAEAKVNQDNRDDRQNGRRERIDRQRGERDGGADIEHANDHLSKTQRDIMKNMGVSQEVYEKFAREPGAEKRNGRGR